MTLSRRRFAGTMGAAALGITPLLRAFAQDALDAIPDGPLRNQVEWILGLLNDPDVEIVADEVAEHFNEDFLAEVPAGQMVQIVESLRAELRGITVTGIEVAPDGHQAQVDVLGNTGVAVRMFVVVETGSGLISGILFQPGEASARGEQATPVAATPIASPVVTAEAPPTTDEILADYQARVDEVLSLGRAFTDAFLAGDRETMLEMFDRNVTRAFGSYPFEGLASELTSNVVSFSMPETGATFVGPYTPEMLAGFYHQQTSGLFQLAPDEFQDGDIPTGLWTGEIVIGQNSMPIEVTFSGTADDLSGTITVPGRDWTDHPLTDVRFEAERPIGALVDERALLIAGASYSAIHEWGDVWFVISSVFDDEGKVSGFSWLMQAPLPDDSADGTTVATTFRLPFDGAWMVIWGGDTEFRNYHAPVPQQRYAHDIAIWRDGSTHTGNGTRNEDYHCYGLPQYAPAGGTIVTVTDGYPDDPPVVGFDTESVAHPAGNHVVIEVAEGEYVLMAHFIPGSIAVTEGDTVSSGDLVGLTGNSGNSSEPHIHIHMQTGPDMLDPSTGGLPMAFTNVLVNGEPVASARIEQGQIVEPA